MGKFLRYNWIVKAFKFVLKRLLTPPVLSLKSGAWNSYIRFPRRIDGGSSISVGEDTLVCEHSWLSALQQYAGENFNPEITIGKGVYIGRYCCITGMYRITIEDDRVLSEHV